MIYLDYAATCPTRPEVAEAMCAEMARPGNPSSLHTAGQRARSVVEDGREVLADAMGCRPSEVILTSGGTESDNLAIKGTYWAVHRKDPRRVKVMVPYTEHHAVLDAVQWLADEQGAELVAMPLLDDGRLDIAQCEAFITEHADTIALVTAMWANNETGAVHPIKELGHITGKHGVILHSDASQAAGKLPVDFSDSGCQLMTISGHKIGGPVGVGALLATTDSPLIPVHHGGGQERGVRSGTLDPVGMLGFSTAMQSATKNLDAEARRLARLRNRLVEGLMTSVDGVHLTGPDLAEDDLTAPLSTWQRLPHLAHVTVAACNADALLFLLDRHGICCSSGSACSAGAQRASHVVSALHMDDHAVRGALRFSLGYNSVPEDVDRVIEVFPDVVKTARNAVRA